MVVYTTHIFFLRFKMFYFILFFLILKSLILTTHIFVRQHGIDPQGAS